MNLLLEHQILSRVQLTSTAYPGATRYTFAPYSHFELGASLKPDGYLSHASAVFLNSLVDRSSFTHYINKEQSPKAKPHGVLTQEGLARAFSSQPRRSNYVLTLGNHRFTLLSGKNTANLGVEARRGPLGEPLQVTGLVRTLIDIAVRPEYAGGVRSVIEAYRLARGRFSAESLIAMLETLDYV